MQEWEPRQLEKNTFELFCGHFSQSSVLAQLQFIRTWNLLKLLQHFLYGGVCSQPCSLLQHPNMERPMTYSVWRCLRLSCLHKPISRHIKTSASGSRYLHITATVDRADKKPVNWFRNKNDDSDALVQTETGSDFKEFPRVLTVLIPSIYSFNKTFSYSGETVRDVPSVDTNLMAAFKSSQSINELCRRLGIPYSYIGGFSASRALEKLYRLRQNSNYYYQGESYVTPAMMEELYVTVRKEVHSLDNKILLRLITYRFAHSEFDCECFEALYAKFLERLHLKVFSVLELCVFSDTLCACNGVNSLSDILYRIWEHVGSRIEEVPREQLVRVYSSVPEQQACVFASLEESLRSNLFKLDFIDIFTISKSVQLKSQRKQELMMVSKWVESNINTITHSQLLQLLNNFNASAFIDTQLLTLLSQYGQTTLQLGATDNTDVISAVLSYLTLSRYYSNDLLELACEHYITDSRGYTQAQLHALLKAVGILNFIPQRQRLFFSKVEQQLLDDFYKLDCLPLLDMFAYLIYVGRVAVNFKPYIFSPLFLGLIRDMTGCAYDQATRKLLFIETAFSDMGFQPRLSIHVDNSALFRRLNRQEYEYFGMNNKLSLTLAEILGPQMSFSQPRPTFEEMYHEIKCDSSGKPISNHMAKYCRFSIKVAVMLLNEDSFSRNVPDHMLGPETANIRMLQARGMKVIGVHAADMFACQQRNNPKALKRFLESLLSRYITFE